MAHRLGNPMARAFLCRAYETGVGAPRDLVRAASCLMIVQSRGGSDVSKDIARVTRNLDEADVARARVLRISEAPAPEFQAEYAPRTGGPMLRPTLPAEPVKP